MNRSCRDLRLRLAIAQHNQSVGCQNRLGMGVSMGQVLETEDLIGDHDLLDQPLDKKAGGPKGSTNVKKESADRLLSAMKGERTNCTRGFCQLNVCHNGAMSAETRYVNLIDTEEV